MRRLLFFTSMVAGAALPLCGGFARAAEPGVMPGPGVAVTEDRSTEGSITSLDLKASPPTIKVTNNGMTRTLQVPNAPELARFRVGQRVRVKYDTQNGKDIARTIELADAKPRPVGTDSRS